MVIEKTDREWLQALVNIGGLRGAENATQLDRTTIKKVLAEQNVTPQTKWKLKTYLNELVTTE